MVKDWNEPELLYFDRNCIIVFLSRDKFCIYLIFYKPKCFIY